MRKVGLDICRISACMAVVMIHTLMLFWEFDPSSPTWAVYNLLAVIVRCGVPLFFMLSGALILSREELRLESHLRRIGHLLLTYFAWSILFVLADGGLLCVWYDEINIMDVLFGSYYHLWFLPAFILCYTFLPLLHSVIHQNYVCRKYIWALGIIVILWLNLYNLPEKPEFLSLFLHHFDLAYLRYLVYFWLGWCIYDKKPQGKVCVLLGVMALPGVILTAWLNRSWSISISTPSDRFYDYCGLGILLLSVFVFSCFVSLEKLPGVSSTVLKKLSDKTFGMYLIHPLLISVLCSFKLDFTQFNTFLFFPACYVTFLVGSLLLSAIIGKIPGLNKLVS